MARQRLKRLRDLVLAVLATGMANGVVAQPAPLDLRFVHDGRERRYLLQLPAVRPDPAPLIMVLHGGGGGGTDAVAFEQPFAHFREIAERDGVIVSYPSAVATASRAERALAASDGRTATPRPPN